MVDQIWHLDLLLQLQGEMFAGLLQDIVSFSHCNFLLFHGFSFCMEFSWILHHRQCSQYLVPFQKWPQVDISPVESLLVVFAYEKHTKEVVSVEEICNGSLGPKLTQEDFDTALQVL